MRFLYVKKKEENVTFLSLLSLSIAENLLY